MSSFLARSSRRYAARHPWQVVLCVLGVAIGVAVVVAIDLANASAERAFDLSTESLVGRATHRIETTTAGLPDAVYRGVRVDLGMRMSAPVVEGTVTALEPGGSRRVLRLLGVDAFAEAPFRARLGSMFEGAGVDITRFMTTGGTGVLTRASAEALDVGTGDELELVVGTRRVALELVGTLDPQDEREAAALGDLLVTDISTAQEMLGLSGRLTRIDLILPTDEAARDAEIARLESLLPPGARVESAAGRSDALASMTRAFRLNLRALSLLALIVGMFLIYNAMTFAVVQRRTWIGTMRALGVTRREIFGIVLREAAVVGIVGSAIGLVLGVVLGRGLVQLVTQTINDLYFVLSVRGLHIDPLVMAKGAALGVGATLLATLVPAIEAAGASPRVAMGRSALEQRWREAMPRLGLGSAVCFLAGAFLLAASQQSLVGSFVGFFGLVAGAALLAPVATVAVMAIMRPVARTILGVLGAMSARGVVAALSRTGVAVAALMTAVSVTVSVGIMIDSFRGTVLTWLESQLQADVYISPPDMSAGRADVRFERDLIEALSKTPGAAGYSTVRRADTLVEGETTQLIAIEVRSAGYEPAYDLKEGNLDEVWQAFRAGEGALISEPFAYRFSKGVGDTIRVRTDRGEVDLPVVAVYYDYASDRGVVALSRTLFERYWDDRAYNGIALWLDEGVSSETLIERVRERIGPEREVMIQSTRQIRELSIEIFDRTFTITAVLRLLAVVVAFVGVLSALMALQLERAREFGVLRANGMTPGQLWQLVLSQTGLMGLVAGLLSLPLGVLLATVMIHVINLRSFGWSLKMSVSPELLGQAMLVSVGAALLAGLYPAFKLSRVSPALALREE